MYAQVEVEKYVVWGLCCLKLHAWESILTSEIKRTNKCILYYPLSMVFQCCSDSAFLCEPASTNRSLTLLLLNTALISSEKASEQTKHSPQLKQQLLHLADPWGIFQQVSLFCLIIAVQSGHKSNVTVNDNCWRIGVYSFCPTAILKHLRRMCMCTSLSYLW